jgi:excisionase family DNA binding protein
MQSLDVSLSRLGYSIAEAEIVTNLSRATLYRAVASGRLRLVKVGRRSLIPAPDLAALCGVTAERASEAAA